MPGFRCGIGFDSHRLAEGRKLVLGGVALESPRGPVAHSDGDVLSHAIVDALLGAAGLGDIGRHFPDDDSQYKNISSCIMLKNVYEKVMTAGYQLGNADITVIAQSPKLSDHIDAMCQKIAEEINVDKKLINIKATTTEQLGFTGRGEGIAAQAIVLLNTAA